MPHLPFPGVHSDMVADVIKTLFILIGVSYLESQKIPSIYSLFITLIVVVFYWSVIFPIAPGELNSCNT